MQRTLPTRKVYIYELPTIYGTITLKFNQATSEEAANEYSYLKSMSDIEFKKRYMGVLRKWSIGYNKRRYIPTFLLWKAVNRDIYYIFHEIAKLRYKTWTSLYKEYPEVKPDKHRKRALFNNDAYLADKANCSIDKVRQVLTDEQIGFILDDGQWDYYEMFEKGKSINDDIIKENGRQLSAQEQAILDHMKKLREKRGQ